jgi:hypothetical protein
VLIGRLWAIFFPPDLFVVHTIIALKPHDLALK